MMNFKNETEKRVVEGMMNKVIKKLGFEDVRTIRFCSMVEKAIKEGKGVVFNVSINKEYRALMG